MKKILLVLFVLIISLSGCSQKSEDKSDKPTVVVSFYVLEAITELLANDQVEIINLLPYNADPHSFELDSSDMIELTESQNLIIVGNDFEHWYEEIDFEIENVLDVSKNISLLSNSLGEVDPHIWTSITNFKQMSIDIAEYLKEIVDDKDAVDQNLAEIINRLNQIEEENIESFNQKKTRLFISQHPAFRYLAAEYDLEMISVSDDGHVSEVSAKKLEEIIQIIEENQIKTVFYENPLEKDIAQTLADETGVQIALLSAMESIDENSQKDIIDLMSDNISILAESLQ